MKYRDLNENKQHGSAQFPIQHYFVNIEHNQYVMQPHWHKEFEFIHIISGNFKLYVENVEYTLTRGDIAFIGCGLLHRGEPDNCIYECVVFDLNMLRRRSGDATTELILPLISGEATVQCILKSNSDMLYSTVSSLFGAMSKKEKFYELSVYSLLFKTLALLYSSDKIVRIEKSKRSGHRANVITALIDWIELHYSEQITLKRLSSLCGMNEKYLCHLFREFTDRTPIDYINNLRIEAACHEMTANHKTVTEAAFDSGFNDLSYFTRTFKKHKGVTPKKYITEHRII